MITIKRYSLCLLALNFFCLNGMKEQISDISFCFENIRDKIDTQLLGINKNICFRPVIGAILSEYKSSFLPIEEVTKELKRIESYILSADSTQFIDSAQDKKHVFKKLFEEHDYVYHLMRALIKDTSEQFKQVKGTTVDTCITPDFRSDITGMNEIIYQRAYDALVRDPYHLYDSINFIVLYGHTNEINDDLFAMCRDSKYLRSEDVHGNAIVWDMQQGIKTDLSEQFIRWSYCKAGYGATHKYYVLSNKPGFDSFFKAAYYFPIKVDNKPAIILRQSPQKIGRICRRAFDNSTLNRDELSALQKSKSITQIKGFPQDNLKTLIQNKITFLNNAKKTD